LRKITRRHFRAVAPPTPFVIAPAPFELAGFQQSEGAIPVCFRPFRIDRGGPVEVSPRIVPAVKVSQGVATVHERVGVIGPEPESTIAVGQRFGGPVEFELGVAAVVVGFRVVRFEHQRAVESGKRALVVAEFA
jgi:hypothetical protein